MNRSSSKRATWRLPPAPGHEGTELEGLRIVREVDGELGGALWLLLRTVTLWSSTDQGSRDGLFPRNAAQSRASQVVGASPPAISKLVKQASVILRKPGEALGTEVAGACEGIADWAESAGYYGTAAEFRRAAAMSVPDDHRRAVAAGRACRDMGDYLLAENWFQRAIALARRVEDWDSYARAHIGLGKLWFRRGRYPIARRHLERAARRAARHGAREAQAMATHDLFNLEFFGGKLDTALETGARAMRLYGAGHEVMPALAFDMAYLMMEKGEYRSALPILRAVQDRAAGRLRMVADGGVARASGHLGERVLHRRAARSALGAPEAFPNKAAVLVEVAQGALALGERAGFDRVVAEAERLARGYGENRVLFQLESLREAAARKTVIHSGVYTEEADQLAHELIGFMTAV